MNDTDYPPHKKFETTGDSTITECWVDGLGGFIMRANDGEVLIVPSEIRRLIAKLMREMNYGE